MRVRSLVSVLLVAAATVGCIDSTTVITVKPDGSGTLEQRVVVNTQAFKGMLQPGSSSFGTPMQDPATQEAEMKAAAAKLGDGVRFVSVTPVKTPDGLEGVAATYAFDNIATLRLDQDPSLTGTPGVTGERRESKPIVFAFTRNTNGTSTITANFTDVANEAGARAAAAAPQGAQPEAPPEMMAMAKAMFAGFRVGIVLQPAGEIVKTNATWVEGSRVTLLEMDLGALLQDEKKLRDIQAALGPNPSVTELKPYMAGLKGLKLNEPVVTVEFR